jgi:hypothetical protein
MKIQCSISGIEFSVEHYPRSLHHSGYYHPIYLLEQKHLLADISRYFQDELTATDSYLLFTALLNSTELFDWRVPAKRTELTEHIISNNIEALAQVIGKINLIKHPSFVLSRIAVTPDTCTLDNVKYWIKSWEDQIEEFQDGYKEYDITRALIQREAVLERIIKSSQSKPERYAKHLSEWASKAGAFPDYIDEYWKEIICKCVRSESIFSVPKVDLDELIEHCEFNISHGSIFSHALMELLRKGRDKQSSFLGLGDFIPSISAGAGGFKILDAEASVEDANILALIASAPTDLPIASDYPNKLAYIKAKHKYELAQSYAASNASKEIQ